MQHKLFSVILPPVIDMARAAKVLQVQFAVHKVFDLFRRVLAFSVVEKYVMPVYCGITAFLTNHLTSFQNSITEL
jgi:hypothetical protein